MKHLLFITIFIYQLLPAQIISYSFSEEFETQKKHADLGFYRFSNNEYIEAYYKKKENITLQFFNSEFKKLLKQETVPLPKNSKHFFNEGFFEIKNRFYWLYSTWDRSTQTERLFALSLNKTSLKFDGEAINLTESGKLLSTMGYDKYQQKYSADSSKILITYTKLRENRNDKLNKSTVGFSLFDHNLTKIYSAEITMPYSEFDMEQIGYEVDNYGNIYLLAKVRINNEQENAFDSGDKKMKDLYRFELMRVNKENNTLQGVKIQLDNKYISSAKLAEDLNHNLLITGYYSNKKRSGSVDGAYIIRVELDEKHSVKKLNTMYCEIPLETLKAYQSLRSQEKMEKKETKDDLEANNLVYRKLIFYPDSSVLIIGEEYYSTTYSYYDGQNWHTRTRYNFNCILAMKVNKNGNLLWAGKIPKFQYGNGFYGFSFHHHSFKNEEYFFYLDNIKNLDLPLDETPYTHSVRGYLTCVKINPDGKMTKTSIFNTKDESVSLDPSNFESLNENLILDRLKADRKKSMVFKLEIR